MPKQWQGGGTGRGGRPWRRKRKNVFERDLYLCRRCKRQGKTTPIDLHGANAGICDHIKPLAEGGTDDESNLETQCQSCCDHKTQAEAAHARGATYIDYGLDVDEDGWPIDPAHPANGGRGGGGSNL